MFLLELLSTDVTDGSRPGGCSGRSGNKQVVTSPFGDKLDGELPKALGWNLSVQCPDVFSSSAVGLFVSRSSIRLAEDHQVPSF